MKTDFLKTIDYEPVDIAHIKTALTHSSFLNESDEVIESNERYEFLGDAVLGFICATYLFENYPGLCEGEMTRMRALIVCEEHLARCAKEISLGEHILLSKGEAFTKGYEKPSILSDCLEAVIGAVYLDKGIQAAKIFVRRHILNKFFEWNDDISTKDFKSLFQELVQQDGPVDIRYELSGQSGPSHDRVFFIDVFVNGKKYGSGKGRTRKEAGQMAARQAYHAVRK